MNWWPSSCRAVPPRSSPGLRSPREVAAGLPSAVTVHSDDDAFAQQLASMLHAPNLRAYSGSDVLGAELGGAMKNVLAVATGIADGMELGLERPRRPDHPRHERDAASGRGARGASRKR